jgi:hypothetical protein
MDDLRNKKPTKIALSESSLSRTKQSFTIFAAKLQGIDGPNSAHVLLAYGSVVKPSFDKLLVCYGKDINLGVSEDGVLLPTTQPTIPQKGQSAKPKGIVLVFINYYVGNKLSVKYLYELSLFRSGILLGITWEFCYSCPHLRRQRGCQRRTFG